MDRDGSNGEWFYKIKGKMIDIKAFVKKILGKWEKIDPFTISEDNLDNLVVVTTSGRKFRLKELGNNESK